MAWTRSPYLLLTVVANLSSIASSSACAPTERRSVATSAAPPAAAATTTGAQPLTSSDEATASRSAAARTIRVMRQTSGKGWMARRIRRSSRVVTEQRAVDGVAETMDDEQVHFLDPCGARVRHVH